MGQKLFRRSLFGFKPSSVTEYIEKASEEFKEKLLHGEEETKKLTGQLEKAMGKNRELEANRDNVSRAIIQAEASAAAIIEEARKKANAEKERIEAETAEAKINLVNLRQQTEHVRKSVIALMNRFTGELEQHTDKG